MLETFHGGQGVHPSSQYLERAPSRRYQTLGELLSAWDRLPSHRFLFGHYLAAAVDLLPAGYATATFLRHPIDRSISILQLHAHLNGRPVSSLVSDDQFLTSHVSDLQTRVFGTELDHGPVRPQEAPVADDNTLQRAIERLSTFRLVGFTEDFERSIAAFDAEFGTLLAGRTRRVNTAPKGDVDRTELVRIVDPLVERDLELYRQARQLSK